MKQSASNIIREVLKKFPGQYMAVHEITDLARLQGHWISDNATASRLCIDLKGEAEGRIREGKRFKEWRLIPADTVKAPPAKPQTAPLLFYSNRRSVRPSPYFFNIQELKSSPGYSMDCMIWTGTHDAPIPYEGEE